MERRYCHRRSDARWLSCYPIDFNVPDRDIHPVPVPETSSGVVLSTDSEGEVVSTWGAMQSIHLPVEEGKKRNATRAIGEPSRVRSSSVTEYARYTRTN